MATSSNGKCSVGLTVSGYGLGENVTVSYSSPKPVSADVFGEEYAGYTVTDIDSAPMVSGDVLLKQTVGETETELCSGTLGEGYFWGFNIFDEYTYAEQEYETIGLYEMSIETLTYSFAVLTNYSVEPPVTVRLTSIEIGDSSEPAVADATVYVKGAQSDAYGDANRDVLFIPYKNER